MKEEIWQWGSKALYVGVFSHPKKEIPETDFCVIFLNAGLIHKIGPNRVYVKIARALAEKGIRSFRFDFSGLGDSEMLKGGEDFSQIREAEVVQAMDMVEQKLGIKKFILMGICSGAESAFRASFDQRIIGLSLMDGIYQDPVLLHKIYQVADRRCKIRYYKKHAFSIKRWAKLLRGNNHIVNKKNMLAAGRIFMRALQYKTKQSPASGTEATGRSPAISNKPAVFGIADWEILFQRNVKIHLIFCEGGTAIDVFNMTINKQLKKHSSRHLLKIELIKDVDHTFTPVWSQNLLTDTVWTWMSKEVIAN